MSQTNNSNNTREEGIQNVQARLVQFLKKKWKVKLMHGEYSGIVRRLLVKKVFSYGYKRGIRRQKLKVKKWQHNIWRYKSNIML